MIIINGMFAIIKTGGKQYIVHPGDKVKIEKLTATINSEVVFDDVLLVANVDKENNDIDLGMPYAREYKVIGRVLSQGKGKKLIIYKYKAKKRYQRKKGHRQKYTEVEIVDIVKK